MKRTALGASLAAVLLVLTGCGDDGGDKSSDSSVDLDGDFPDCSDVWVEGETLPDGFEGCMDGDTLVDITFTSCKDGTTELRIHQTATGENTHFALTGEPIQVYTDEAKSEAYLKCQPQ